MKSKTAIFDLDGTLFDTLEVNYQAYRESLNKFGFELERDYYVKYCDGHSYKKFLPAIIGHDEELLEEIHRAKKASYPGWLHTAKVNEHLFTIAECMKEEYNLAVVTTASKKNALEILDFFQKREVFELIITQEDVQHVKPDPEGFVKAMNHFHSSPEETIIFEDSDTGMKAALQTGAGIFRIQQF